MEEPGRTRPPDPATVDGLVGGGLVARLDRWAAEVRVEDAARQRSRERWLRQQADEEASVAGVLLDLAERGTPVTLHLGGGRRRSGQVVAVAADFAVMVAARGVAETPWPGGQPGEHALVALRAISSIRPRGGPDPATGDRVVRTGLRLSEALADLAAERERVLVVSLDGHDSVAGILRAVGRDVVVVRPEGEPPGSAVAYVPLGAVGEVLLGT